MFLEVGMGYYETQKLVKLSLLLLLVVDIVGLDEIMECAFSHY